MATVKTNVTYNNKTVEKTGSFELATGGTILKTNLEFTPTVTLNLQTKTVTYVTDVTGAEVTPDSGYDGLDKVVVNVNAGTSGVNNYNITIAPATTTITKSVGEIPSHTPAYTGYGTITVSAAKLGTKSVTPSETSQTITPDSGDYGLSQVTVAAITSTYVGSGITSRTTADVNLTNVVDETATDKDNAVATVVVPAGYYATAVTKSVTLDILPSIDSNATAPYIRSGYSAYNDEGVKIDGTMPNAVLSASAGTTVSNSGTNTTLPTLTPGYKLHVTPSAGVTTLGYTVSGTTATGTDVVIPIFELN